MRRGPSGGRLTRGRRSGIGGDMRSLLASLSLLLAAFTVSVSAQEKAWEPKPRARSFPWMSYADWNSMHDAMLRRALQGDVDVLFLGDSIACTFHLIRRGLWCIFSRSFWRSQPIVVCRSIRRRHCLLVGHQ